MDERDDDLYALCDWCELPIRYGNAMTTVSRNVEQIDRSAERGDGEVTVIDSEELLTLCARCGNRLDKELLRHLLRTGAPARD